MMLYIALGGVSHFDWPYLIFAIIVIFLFSRNQSVGQIWKISVHSSIFQDNQSINAALSAHEFQSLWFLSDCPTVFQSFLPP